jgi:hypothetical protein
MVDLVLTPGKTKTTTDPVVRLKLPEGEWMVELVVVDAEKRESLPVAVKLIVKKG